MFLNKKNKKSSVQEQYTTNGHHLLTQALFNSSRLLSGLQQGAYTSFFRSSGLEYAESKIYNYGDDARHINWKVSSRFSTLYTKQFHEDTNRLVWIIFDCSGSTQIGAPRSLFEVGIEALLTILRIALHQKNKVGGVLFSENILCHIRPSKANLILDKFLYSMMEFQFTGGGSNLEEAIQFTRNTLTQRSLVIICSDFVIDDCYTQIQKVSRIHDVLLIRTQHKAKELLSFRGIINVSDTEKNLKGIFKLSNLRYQLSASQAEEEQQWIAFCSQNHITNLTIDTSNSVLTQLISLFTKRRRKHI